MGVIVVTGAGSGLGRALAVELVARGHQVAGLGRRAEALAETAGLAGPGFHPLEADLSDPAQVRAAFDAAGAIGEITILINNAAIYPRRDILDETVESLMETMAINFGGTAACTLAALRIFVATGRGRILNVGSFTDMAPAPLSAGYSVSKGAARILTRALVVDLGDRFPGIVINDWMPGILATGMGREEGLDPALAARWGAELALMTDPSLNGTVWERDQEIPPPQSLRGRILARLSGRRRLPQRLGG